MSDTKLTITLDLDRRKATQQAQAFRAEQRKLARDLLADEAAAERTREDLARKEAHARIDAAGRARDAMGRYTKQAADDATAHFGAIGKAGRGAFTGIGKAVGSFAVQMLGLNSAQAVVGAIIDNFELARQNAYKASQMVNDYRQSLLELAALKGKLGNTTEVLGEDVAFRAKTLQTREEASAFQKSALGVGESAIGVNVSRPEWEKALALAGKFQAVEGESADVHGSLIGTIATLATKKMTGQELFDKEQQLFHISQPGGFSFASGMQQFAKLAPLVKSGVFKDTEMMALLAGFSTSNREGAGENVQQFARATIGSLGKMSGVRIEGAEKVGAYLKSIGLTDEVVKHTEATKLPFAIGDAIVADLDRAKKEAAGKGEEFNPAVYLKHKGYGNQEDAMALLSYYGLKQTGALQSTFMPRAQPEALPAAKKAMAEFEARQKNDPAYLARQAEFRQEAANIAVGAGPQEYVNSLKKAAFSAVRARGETSYSTYEDVQALGTLNPANWLFNERGKVNMEAQRMLASEADRLGIPHNLHATADRETGISHEFYAGDENLSKLAQRIAAAGGNVLPGGDEVTNKALAGISASNLFGATAPAAAPAGGDMKQTNQLLKQISDKLTPRAPAPLVGAPVTRNR